MNFLHADTVVNKQQTGEAIVESIEKKAWWLDAGAESIGRGDYVIAIRLIQPRVSAKKQILRVVKKEDMIIDGRMLESGDRFSFEARDAFFEKRIFGPTFQELKNIKLVVAPKMPMTKPGTMRRSQSVKGVLEGANISYLARLYNNENNIMIYTLDIRILDDKKYRGDHNRAAGVCHLWLINREGQIYDKKEIDFSTKAQVIDAANPIAIKVEVSKESTSESDEPRGVAWYYMPSFLAIDSNEKAIDINPVGGILQLKK